MRQKDRWQKRFFRSGGAVGLLLLLGLLSGCAGTGDKTTSSDPPKPSEIADAKPKVEPRSKYGNPKSYVVFGKRYYTKASSKGYVERGMASWYGKKFHGRKTSNGERYNMYAMTAAHKALPLPTYVRVTLLANRRSVVVRVNDRGPFHGRRIIDLSYAAARKLGMATRGTALVEVRAIDPRRPKSGRRHSALASADKARKRKTRVRKKAVAAEKTQVAKKPAPRIERVAAKRSGPAPRPAVYLQVGAFGNRTNAEHLRRRLAKHIAEQPVEVRMVSDTKASWHKVQVGPFNSRKSANHLSRQLASLGLEGFHVIVK
ncbi:MAG: septal ring lytic transglycosylase RlpA family protein [Candidatus Thiosymbion ectosymbiont of Robbea hypermnestra]|nr:septal ring lytic transglycosylase RlpA family protein [Candidatus Thiosymbion ectosymbiont of Robbea hypermnestra]